MGARLQGLGASTKLPLSYVGCPFHRVIKGFMLQGTPPERVWESLA